MLSNRSWPASLVLLGLVILSGCATTNQTTPTPAATATPAASTASATGAWKNGAVILPGYAADADAVALPDGRYRLYYGVAPEGAVNGQLPIQSAISTDGVNWTKEEGTRIADGVFPDVLALPDGTWRMYFQFRREIHSATSRDGLNWITEPGVRLPNDGQEGLNLENVAAPTTLRLSDGTYLMVYRGTAPGKYLPQSMSDTTGYLFSATSSDGLAFTKQGMVLDSRNTTFQGMLDGPDLVAWDGGEIRLYFWSAMGVYYVTYKDGAFGSQATPAFDLGPNPNGPPCDPNVIKIGGKWFMYYGQFKVGISYATLEQ